MSRKPNSKSRSYRRSISFTAQASALAAFLGLVTGWVRRWGRRLYWPISTCFGSTRMRRTWSGVVRISSDVMMQLMPLDLPASHWSHQRLHSWRKPIAGPGTPSCG